MKTKRCNFCGSDRYEERCIEYADQDPCVALCSGVGFGHRLWSYLTSLSEGKTDVFGSANAGAACQFVLDAGAFLS